MSNFLFLEEKWLILVQLGTNDQAEESVALLLKEVLKEKI